MFGDIGEMVFNDESWVGYEPEGLNLKIRQPRADTAGISRVRLSARPKVIG